MILCDTNIFIHAFNGNEKTIATLKIIGLQEIVLSAITLMELYQLVGCISKASYTFVNLSILVHDTVFRHPTFAIDPMDLFSLWQDHPKQLEEIRQQAWHRFGLDLLQKS